MARTRFSASELLRMDSGSGLQRDQTSTTSYDDRPCPFAALGLCKKGAMCSFDHGNDPNDALLNPLQQRHPNRTSSSNQPGRQPKAAASAPSRSFATSRSATKSENTMPARMSASGPATTASRAQPTAPAQAFTSSRAFPTASTVTITQPPSAQRQYQPYPPSDARLKDFRWRIPTNIAAAKPLGHTSSKFWALASELTDGDAGAVQETITLLTSEGGLLRVSEVLEQPFETLTNNQYARYLSTQLLPLLKVFTHTKVLSSSLLRAKVATVYNVVYAGDGNGERAIALFSSLAGHLAEIFMPKTASGANNPDNLQLESLETAIVAFSVLLEFNTPAHGNAGLVPPAEQLAAILESLPESTAFAMNKAKSHLLKLHRRLGIGHELLETQAGKKKTPVRATFEFARELPGSLSEAGPRHDNDHEDMTKIQILPTLQEILSSREEYLPSIDPRQWHLAGASGLLDRHFRLLREDTVGQVRDAANFELRRLQNPLMGPQINRQGARTYVYQDVQIITAAVDAYHGLHFVMRFAQPRGCNQTSKRARQDWWDFSRRLGQEALICLLGSSGTATFFVVLSPFPKPVKLQKTYDLSSDPNHAHVIVKPVNHDDYYLTLANMHDTGSQSTYSIAEFPGVLLPAFEPTLRALQRNSKTLDMPFQDILAPSAAADDPSKEMENPPPTYATKPGFEFELSSITSRGQRFSLSAMEDVDDAAEELATMSGLDRGQASAVVSSLTRGIAAIQGPPGTGKSYTGVQLIRSLLANKVETQINAILLCTQTNHALDAVLERSIDDGVSNIVRIGSRSKSERLQNVNLKALAQQIQKTKTERLDYKILSQEQRSETEEIEQLLPALRAMESDQALQVHLLENYPTRYVQLVGKKDDDGFTVVEGQQSSFINNWLKKDLYRTEPDRSLHELEDVNLHRMTATERQLLYRFWKIELADELDEKFRRAFESFTDINKKLAVITREKNLRVLQQANIIGVTTSGLARNLDLLRDVNPKVLICEEAGEVLEAHLLTALLPSVEHCILIGDHQQLRPQVSNYGLSSESRDGAQYSLDLSLFERLVQPMDTFAQPLPFSTLDVQRRMHPSISQLVRQTQYPHLQDDPRVSQYPEVVGMRRRLFWMDHQQREDPQVDGELMSRTNEFEVEMVAALVKHIVQQGVYKAQDIAVITPYLGQLRKLRSKFQNTHAIILTDKDEDDLAKEGLDDDEIESELRQGTSRASLTQAIQLATVDAYQGNEAACVIVSLVRSNPQQNVGFLRTPNRINVLLSRAKHGMYIFGNTHTTENVPMWRDVTDILRADGNLGDALELSCERHPDRAIAVQTPEDFARLSPEAGCDLPCDKPLGCGHSCGAKCHSEVLHGVYQCKKPCLKPRETCEHPCAQTCGEKCNDICKVLVEDAEITLACGHKKTGLRCCEIQNPSTIVCNDMALRTKPGCLHTRKIPCAVNVNMKSDIAICLAFCGELHGTDTVKALIADRTNLTAYEDVNLVTDPCIFTDCGHIFTVDWLDAAIGIDDHYEIDSDSGELVGLKTTPGHFAMRDLASCPDCRGSLHGLARYGRITRQALLDKTAEKLAAFSTRKYQDFAARLDTLENELITTVDSATTPTQNLRIAGDMSDQLIAVQRAATAPRYKKLLAFLFETGAFIQKLGREEQSYHYIHDLLDARQQDCTARLQLCENLKALNLLNRTVLVLISDIAATHNATPLSTRGFLQINLTTNRKSCEGVIQEAIVSKHLCQQAEASVMWAKYAAIECAVMASKESGTGWQQRLDDLKEEGLAHLDDATDIWQQQKELAGGEECQPWKGIMDEMECVLGMLNGGSFHLEDRVNDIAKTEKGDGTGWWLCCENGHPFEVDRSVLLEEQARRCSECGSGVGGERLEE
ncbi:nf-x1 finger and helicase domain containing protein [Zymoseptoria brevis]|uniref:Nf-x1 finger and helicase domain containing protein n=1 Tax=Zymoseptoria brevis TaxID=1047168 RepID=A0A0F4GG91_9PEZI|nr:nf-x1 finger and helicase domain containing protein [Zymoseptoria brevis]